MDVVAGDLGVRCQNRLAAIESAVPGLPLP
jgi:hypothetical protein